MSKVSIAIITPSLGNGGAERVSSQVSIFLSNLGYDVTVFAAYSNQDFQFKGTYVHLGLDKNKGNPFSLMRRSFFKLFTSIKNGSFDIVVDFRSRRIFFIETLFHLFIYSKVKHVFLTIHLPLIEKYIPRPWFIFKPIYKRATGLIAVSQAINDNLTVLGYSNSKIIKNAIDFGCIDDKKHEALDFSNIPYVLAVGRMDDDIKRFDHIIKAYANSVLPGKGVQLVILGDGKIKPELIELSKNIGGEDLIRFEGFQKNPFKYFAKAHSFVLASRFEGFPMVLIESLACGTPVISYDCLTGPSEIINDGHNGLLVENGNIAALSTAITRMHTDEKLYAFCKNNARQSVDHLAMEHIQQQWLTLLETTAV